MDDMFKVPEYIASNNLDQFTIKEIPEEEVKTVKADMSNAFQSYDDKVVADGTYIKENKHTPIILVDSITYVCKDIHIGLQPNYKRKDGKNGVLIIPNQFLHSMAIDTAGRSIRLGDILPSVVQLNADKSVLPWTTQAVIALNNFGSAYDPTGKGFIAVNGTPIEHIVSGAFTPQRLLSPLLVDDAFWSAQSCTPFAHQKYTAAFLAGNDRCYVFNGLGTGKTKATLWAIKELLRCGLVKRAIFLAPLSCLQAVWGDEIWETYTTDPIESIVLHGTASRRTKLVSAINATKENHFVIINHDGIKSNKIALETMDVDLVVVDEASSFRTHTSERHKVLSALTKHWGCKLWCLTGTPVNKNPADAWGLARLVRGKTLRVSYNTFFDMTMCKVGEHVFLPRPGSVDKARELLEPNVCFSTRQCIDMPPLRYMHLGCELSTEGSKLWRVVQDQGAAVLEDGRALSAANAGTLINKLLQVCCGGVRLDDGSVHKVNIDNKLKLLDDCFEETQNDKLLVFVPFLAAVDVVSEYLRKKGATVYVINGETALADRSKIFKTFTDADKGKHVIVAIPQAMSHGINLTATHVTVFFAPIYSPEIFTQAIARMARPSQTEAMTVFLLSCSPLENRIYRALEQKMNMSNELLQLCRELFV